MRRDTQIGVILGVVIIGIIAVFLSTKTDVKKSQEKELTSNKEKEAPSESALDIFEGDTFVEETLESGIKEDVKEEVKELVTLKEEEEVESLDKEDEHLAAKETEKATKDITADDLAAEKGLDEKIENKEIEIDGSEKETKVLTHKVELNDNLFSLAKRYYGDPKEWIQIYNANVDVIYDRNSLPVGNELIIPNVKILDAKKEEKIASTQPLKTITEPSSEKQTYGKKHKVKAGDSLYALSRSYYGNTKDWKLIYNANKDILGSSNVLIVGQELTIPETGLLAGKKEEADQYLLRSQIDNSKILSIAQKMGYETYTIKKGDTLYSIAKLHYNDGSKWKQIYDANRNVLTSSSFVPAGKTIVIPK